MHPGNLGSTSAVRVQSSAERAPRRPSAAEAIAFPSRPRLSEQRPRLGYWCELKLEEIARPREVGLDVPDPGVLGVAGGDVHCIELWALACISAVRSPVDYRR